MIKNTEDYFEDLAKSYPDLMEKAICQEYLGVDLGWFNIINTLCSCIYAPLQQAKFQLKAAIEYPHDTTGEYIAMQEALVKNEIDALPVIRQIKEKYASLRFYVSNSNDRIDTLISFAENMSRCTCSVCGNVGKLDNTSTSVKIRCAEHFTAVEIDNEFHHGKVSAKFQDNNV
jgi:hypothetical protein